MPNDTWKDAYLKGIVLVPFKSGQKYITAACPISVLEAAVGADDLNNWEAIYDLGLSFFVDICAPGNGATLEESYTAALKAYEETRDPIEERKVKIMKILEKRNA